MIILVFIFFVFTACAMDGMDSRLNVENQSPFPAKVVFECKNAFLKIHFWENAKKDTIIVIRKDILDSIRNDKNWKIIIR